MSFYVWYKRFVLILSFLFAIAVGLIILKSAALNFDSNKWMQHQVKIGSDQASIELIIFEDILCEECENFFLHVFPLIKKNYIDTNLVKFVWVPIEALGNSDLVISHILCLNKLSSLSALNFLTAYFEASSEDLQEKFQIAQLKYPTPEKPCSANEEVKNYLQDNMIMAEKMMQNEIEIPTIFIQGKKLDDVGYFSISKEIDHLLLDERIKK